jgi:taurine dioxygenase
MFLSAMAAYQELAPELETKLVGMHAVHSCGGTSSPVSNVSKSESIQHPVLRQHPLTGKTALFVNEGHVTRIAELPQEASTVLLKQLFAHLDSDKYVYRHKWKCGDLILSDNNSMQYRFIVDDAPDQPRCLERITIRTSPRQTSAGD